MNKLNKMMEQSLEHNRLNIKADKDFPMNQKYFP